MKIAATQPTFLPYPGYFSLMDLVDEFIIMDNIQFDSRSWQQRNYILFNNKQTLLTVPVLKKKKSSQKISEVNIDTSKNYINKHLNTIEQAYKKKPFFKKYFSQISSIYLLNSKNLIDLNLKLIKLFMKILSIDCKLELLSNLEINSFHKDELIYQICKKRKCQTYISTLGAKNYLEQNNKLKLDFKLNYFIYEDKNKDKNDNFLSILDLIFNYGPESLAIIKSGTKLVQ